ncbi:hypothetical protein GQ55_6G065700 [Panicum hallii var. hallii]|uniref:Uncharacterized protein n=1 Tax=Panicum hallii var. hallii TaxID=1504633 RepID=A0A2T7D4Q8_9POAL|nr:hypothetical protein GQ55_6G065700 [Panicum hallii var. hallii]
MAAGQVERRQPDHLPRLLRLLRRTYRRSHLPPAGGRRRRPCTRVRRRRRGWRSIIPGLLNLLHWLAHPVFSWCGPGPGRPGNKMRMRHCSSLTSYN